MRCVDITDRVHIIFTLSPYKNNSLSLMMYSDLLSLTHKNEFSLTQRAFRNGVLVAEWQRIGEPLNM